MNLTPGETYIYKPTSMSRGLPQPQLLVTLVKLDNFGHAVVAYQDRFKIKKRVVSPRFLHEPTNL